nr:hypothetical protein [Tanacetum cinerariifolium]
MTRSSTKELFTPFEDLEQEFCSSRNLFKTLSLNESSSFEFDLSSNLKEHYEGDCRNDDKNNGRIHVQDPRFKELLMRCPQHYLTNMQEVILFYNGLAVPTKQILDSKGAIPTMTANNAKITIQQMAEYSQKWHNRMSTRTRSIETSDGLAAIQAQRNNLGREIKKDVKVPLILGRPFLSTAHAKIDVFKRKITLRVGDEKIIFKSVKPASSLIKRVYMLSLRERMELDLKARNQADDLKPIIEEGEVDDEPIKDIDKARV